MLSIARAVANRVSWAAPRLTTRSFAEVVAVPSVAASTPPAPSERQSRKPTSPLKERIPVKEDHGLYAFFRKKDDDSLVGDAKYEVTESPESMQKQTGESHGCRSWKASELRLKSFRDLHMLWYILLRERNLLATQKEEVRRMGVTNTEMQVSARRVYHCRKSMARIKAVINERRLAYEGAVEIVEAQQEEEFNKEVGNYMKGACQEERKYLQRRREYKARKLQKKLEATEAAKAAPSADVAETAAT
ncbi:hypothetical protein D9615_002850 [Tricholomella constricta]|uniref:Large ribosomal subunit protein uL29m n=1 Tax=Tricholomella constricta TaxID=117010 RepID=A0A8H5M667_9AGAR|nr:hypothetical protein D9615_002850 [Tricholomella constricta]